jgi:hypothetical protein
MGYRELMQIETAVLSGAGQSVGGPTGLVDQSKARMRSPISPPPLRKLRSHDFDTVFSCADLDTRCFAVEFRDILVNNQGQSSEMQKGCPIKERLPFCVNGFWLSHKRQEAHHECFRAFCAFLWLQTDPAD